jgi:hypothetical protein
VAQQSENPSLDEMMTYVRVREYLRWHRPEADKELGADDDLFSSGEDSVKFGFEKGTNLWTHYVAGYFNAARALLEGPNDGFFLTFAIYPVLFLYRHYIELEIKNLMMECERILQIPIPEFGSDHHLLSLWGKLKQMLPPNHSALENAVQIERILTQFTAIDPKSMDTRYGLRRDLRTAPMNDPVKIGISQLRQAMDRLNSEFMTFGEVVAVTAQAERRLDVKEANKNF